jgi:quinol monooxygenase YgiN
MHTASIVLNIAKDKTDEFERGFKEFELPTHRDLYERGLLVMSLLARISDIATQPVEGAVQYLVIAVFKGHEGHDAHDNDPRFKKWNKKADAYQIEGPIVFGGDTIVVVGPAGG